MTNYLRIALAMPKLQIGDIAANLNEIKRQIVNAESLGAGILVLPPFSITGKHIGELLKHSFFYEKHLEALREIKRFTKGKTIMTVLSSYWMLNEKLLFGNFFIKDGDILSFNSEEVEKRNHKFGISCDFDDDIFFIDSGMLRTDDGILSIAMGENRYVGANLIIKVDTSKNFVGKADEERQKAIGQTLQYQNTVAYISCGSYESVTDGIYIGDMFVCEKGKIIAQKTQEHMEETLLIADVNFDRNFKGEFQNKEEEVPMLGNLSLLNFDDIKYRKYKKNPFLPEDESKRKAVCMEIFKMQSLALARRLDAINAKKAVIGVSGGLDSTLALLVCVRAMEILGKDFKDVLAITMPGFGTGTQTFELASILLEELGVAHKNISINDAVRKHFEDIGHDENVKDATYENSQARERTQILMDLANSVGGIVVGTGDMSELALGWCTYNGDHMSMYGVNCGIPKTVVKEVVKAYADQVGEPLSKALYDIANLPISPELLPPVKEGEILQLTEEKVGPYELQDFFLYHTLRNRLSPKELTFITKLAFENYSLEEIKKYQKIFYERFASQQFKRNCMPDGVGIFDISLSPRQGFAMPSDFTMKEWLKELES